MFLISIDKKKELNLGAKSTYRVFVHVNFNQSFNVLLCLSVFINLNLSVVLTVFLAMEQLSGKFNLDGNIELQVFSCGSKY